MSLVTCHGNRSNSSDLICRWSVVPEAAAAILIFIVRSPALRRCRPSDCQLEYSSSTWTPFLFGRSDHHDPLLLFIPVAPPPQTVFSIFEILGRAFRFWKSGCRNRLNLLKQKATSSTNGKAIEVAAQV